MEKEYIKWLRRPELAFSEKLEFIINAWNSVDLLFNRKHEVTILWITEQIKELKLDLDFSLDDFKKFLAEPAHPATVSLETKKNFLNAFMEFLKREDMNKDTPGVVLDLLIRLIKFELMQDLYNHNYEIYAQLYGQMLTEFQRFFKNSVLSNNVLAAFLLDDAMTPFLSYAKNVSDIEKFRSFYTKHVLLELTRISCSLGNHRYIEELEAAACKDLEEAQLLERIFSLAEELRIPLLTAAVINTRCSTSLLKILLQRLNGLSKADNEISNHMTIVHVLRKLQINLSFPMTENISCINFLGESIFAIVERYRAIEVDRLLLLLCNVMDYNPLILEKKLYQIMAWMMLAPKSNCIQKYYEHFMVTCIEFVRRISRAEKFVVLLPKAIKECLKQRQTVIESTSNTKKRPHEDAMDVEEDEAATKSVKRMTPEQCRVCLYRDIVRIEDAPKGFSNARNCVHLAALDSAWPKLVYKEFGILVRNLMAKPSIVIWKTLTFSLKDTLLEAQNESIIKQSTILLLDLQCAWLCGFLANSRLVEHRHKHQGEIDDTRELLLDVLRFFGQLVVHRENDDHLLVNFIQCCLFTVKHEQILHEYMADNLKNQSYHKVTSILEPENWRVIRKRFKKHEHAHIYSLFTYNEAHFFTDIASQEETGKLKLKDKLLTHIKSNCKSLEKTLAMKSIISKLSSEEKYDVIRGQLHRPDVQALFMEDMNSLKCLAFANYENLMNEFSRLDKCCALISKQLKIHELAMLKNKEKINDAIYLVTKVIVNYIQNSANKEVIERVESSVQTQIETETLVVMQTLMEALPGHLMRPEKTLIVLLQLGVMCDLKDFEDSSYTKLGHQLLLDILYFGSVVPVEKLFRLKTLLQITPFQDNYRLYLWLFDSKSAIERIGLYESLVVLLREEVQSTGRVSGSYLVLLIRAIDALGPLTGLNGKRMESVFRNLIIIFDAELRREFNNMAHTRKRNINSCEEYLKDTMCAMSWYADYMFRKHANSQEGNPLVLDRKFLMICRIYTGYSLKDLNIDLDMVRLVKVLLNNKEKASIEQGEVELILANYWAKIIKSLYLKENADATDQSLCDLITAFRSDEFFYVLLRNLLESNLLPNPVKKISLVMKILKLMANSTFNKNKAAILDHHLKLILQFVAMTLGAQNIYSQPLIIDEIFKCMAIFAANTKIPFSTRTVDTFIETINSINIETFITRNNNPQCFKSLIEGISYVLEALIDFRSVLVMDRVPHFVDIFQNVVVALIRYKSDRPTEAVMSKEELEMLNGCAAKVEHTMKNIHKHKKDFKRLAPMTLMYIMTKMVKTQRPTTLYKNIKFRIDSILHDLLDMCDRHMEGYILRNSNDAARQLYEGLIKDHNKYFKFKGKI